MGVMPKFKAPHNFQNHAYDIEQMTSRDNGHQKKYTIIRGKYLMFKKSNKKLTNFYSFFDNIDLRNF